MRSFVLLACLVGVAFGAVSHQKVNPVQKVISLLEKMQSEVQEEGKAEAAAYDKFACFCKDTADNKLYTITKGHEHVAVLTAAIENLETEIADLAAETAATRQEISNTQDTMEAEQATRDGNFAQFQSDDNDLQGAIDELERAINKLEGSKSGMVGAKVALLEKNAKKALRKLLASRRDVQASPKQLKAVYALLEERKDPAAHASEFQSNEHIAVLKELLKTYKANQFERQTEEENDKHAFNMAQQARTNIVKAMHALVAKNEEIEAKKSEEKSAHEADNAQTAADTTADQTFLDELTEECENKATAWDTRSKVRSNELTAMGEALGLLKNGVAGNYGANKKLNLVTKKAVVQQADDVEDSEDDDEEVSFLQRRDTHTAQRRQALKFLSQQAKALKSPVLSMLVMKIKEDHFKKVRDLIKDMVARLESEAEAEASQKGWCDEEMASATEKRDENQAKIELENANIIMASAKVEKLSEEIRTLGAEIADLYKALNEQTQLREEDHTDNVNTLADSNAGLTALRGALTVLQDFYNNPSGEFVQTSYEPFKAAGSGADGKTVADLAPGTFDGAYEGKQNESGGILGLLNVIESDFERTISTTEQAETDSEAEFQQFKTDTDADIDSKKTDKSNKEGEREGTEADNVGYKDELKDAKTLKGESLDELEKLKPACVSTGSNYEEKVARRKQEIEALKEATKILTDMR